MSDKKIRSDIISKKIKELRDAVGWSQSELARQSGVTSAAISQLEKGDRIPSLIVSRKLANALKVSVNELTGDETPSSNELNNEAQLFFREFGGISKLSEHDQQLIMGIVNSMKEKNSDTK